MAVKQGSSNSAHMLVTHGSNMTDMAKFKDRLNLVLNKTSKLLEFKLSPRLASLGPHPTPRWSSHCTSAVLDEANVLGVAAEALPAAHQPILPDQSMRVGTDPADAGSGPVVLGVRVPHVRVPHRRLLPPPLQETLARS